MECGKVFQPPKRARRRDFVERLWSEYVWGKQTLEQLSAKHGLDHKTIQKYFRGRQPDTRFPYELLPPHPVFLVIDAYYRKRGDGTIVLRVPESQQNLLWYDIEYETIMAYTKGVDTLVEAGWKVKGVTIDGRPGTSRALEYYAPVQHCQFHQQLTVTKYLTKRPKFESHVALKRVASTLTKVNEVVFTQLLDAWFSRYGHLLKERTHHPGGGWSYTHEHLRSCYNSLRRNLPHLFTYQRYPGMPNTTNSLDGSISHLRTLHRIHRGKSFSSGENFSGEVLRGKSTNFSL
jgi:hypothetical protein